ncbi:MAG: O-antigen ligase family protein [Thermomicrobiales bacterium]
MMFPATIRLRFSPAHIVAIALALGGGLILFAIGPAGLLLYFVVASLAIAGLQHPSIPIAAIVVSIPLQSQLSILIDDRSVTWTKMAVLAAVIAATTRFLIGNAKIRLTGIAFTFGAFVLVLAASIVNAQDLGAWAGEVYRWSIAFLIYLIAVEATGDDRFFPIVTTSMAISVAGASIGGLYQTFAHVGPKTFGAHGLTRAYSAFGEPNPFAAYLEMSVPLLAAIALACLVPMRSAMAAKRPDQWYVGMLGVSAAIGSIALLFSQSRGGLLGFSAAMATVVWLSIQWAKWLVLGGLAVLLLLTVNPLSESTVRERLVESVGNPTADSQVTTENWAVQERIAHWRAGIAMWRDYPFLGVGAGNYSHRFRAETQVWRFRISRGHAHSSYIQAAAQAGATGFAFYLTLLSVALATCIRRLRMAPSEVRSVVVGGLGVTIAVIVHGVFDYLHVLSLGLQLSVVWAMLELARRSKARRWPRLNAIGSRV